MPNILDLFNQREVLNYLENRQFPALLGETLFPEVKREGLEFDMIKGASKVPVIASVHAFDTEAEIGSREAYKQALELALIKRKMQLKEKDIMALENPRNAVEQQYLMQNVFNDIEVLVNGVKARVEAMRMEALAKGTVTLENEKGVISVLDYQVPAANKQTLSGTSAWTDASSDPLADIDRWQTAIFGMGSRALTSRAVLSALLKHPKVIAGIYGAGSGRMVTVADLNGFMEQQGLPRIATYDAVYRKQLANGSYTQQRYLPNNSFTMFGDGPLGETIYGNTPEEIRLRRDPSIEMSKVGNVLAMVYEETVDPVGTWEKAVATALPSFPSADEVFQATPIA